MGVDARSSLLVTLALVFSGCGESFSQTEAGGAGGTTTTGGSTSASGGDGGSGGGSSVTGGGGAGGTTCKDADMDGYSTCDGDCDDDNPNIHPGAVEICGDGIDQNCDDVSELGPPCNNLGTFVSQKYGQVGGHGTIDDPVATIEEGIANAELISDWSLGEPTWVVVSAGTYVEDLTVMGKIGVLGGFDPDDWSVRDAAIFTTTIKNTKVDGIKLLDTEAPMLLEGLSIEGRNVTSGSGSSVGITINGGAPLILSNVIKAGDVTAGTGSSVGVHIINASGGDAGAVLFDNVIDGGDSIQGGSYGVEIISSTVPVILGKNQINAAKGVQSVALLVEGSAGLEVSGNRMQATTATGMNGVPSTSLGVWVKSGPLLFNANVVNSDQVFNPTQCFTPDVWCGGVRSSAPDAVITNNIIYGSSSNRSAALELLETVDNLDNVIVSSNLLAAGGKAGAATKSTAVLLSAPDQDGSIASIGRFRNNILFGGIAESNFGFVEEQVPGEPIDPSALDHNLFFFPSGGTLFLDWNGLSQQTIVALDGLPGQGANLLEDPLVDNRHIDPASPCRNAGTEEDSPPLDIDGDLRPQEGDYDIGPDELLPAGN